MKNEERIDRLAEELARAADLSGEQARRVLSVLRVEALVENIDELRNAMENPKLAKALGQYPEQAKQIASALNQADLSLAKVGLVFKSPDLLGLEVPV